MRVWVIEPETAEGSAPTKEPSLSQLARQPEAGLSVVGSSAFHPDLPSLLRNGLLHALVVDVEAWPSLSGQAELLALGLPILLIGEPQAIDQWTALAAEHVMGFLPLIPRAVEVRAALWSLLAARDRESHLNNQVARLQQRLSDRIIIEKGKGVLQQRLGISEEQAYQQLRIQSRRQRKQIRDIAQALLEAAPLLSDVNGLTAPADRMATGTSEFSSSDLS